MQFEVVFICRNNNNKWKVYFERKINTHEWLFRPLRLTVVKISTLINLEELRYVWPHFWYFLCHTSGHCNPGDIRQQHIRTPNVISWIVLCVFSPVIFAVISSCWEQTRADSSKGHPTHCLSQSIHEEPGWHIWWEVTIKRVEWQDILMH